MTSPREPGGGGFDRIPSRRAHQGPGDPDGRAALFSVTPEEAPGAAAGQGFGLTVTCSACGTVSAISPIGLVIALLPATVVLPWRPHCPLGVCPACRHRAWLALGLRW